VTTDCPELYLKAKPRFKFKPETQQVRALEAEMRRRLDEQGLADVTPRVGGFRAVVCLVGVRFGGLPQILAPASLKTAHKSRSPPNPLNDILPQLHRIDMKTAYHTTSVKPNPTKSKSKSKSKPNPTQTQRSLS
jgi:hypothetical protein